MAISHSWHKDAQGILMILHNFAPFPSGIPQCEKTQVAGEMIEMVDFRMLGQTWPDSLTSSTQALRERISSAHGNWIITKPGGRSCSPSSSNSACRVSNAWISKVHIASHCSGVQ